MQFKNRLFRPPERDFLTFCSALTLVLAMQAQKFLRQAERKHWRRLGKLQINLTLLNFGLAQQ